MLPTYCNTLDRKLYHCLTLFGSGERGGRIKSEEYGYINKTVNHSSDFVNLKNEAQKTDNSGVKLFVNATYINMLFSNKFTLWGV